MADKSKTEEMRRIGRFEQSNPVHARCDNPAFDFQDVIGIEFGQCQSVTMGQIHLGADISFGPIELTIDGQPYEFSLAAARVRLEHENADVQSASRYRHVLTEGKIEASFSEKELKSLGVSIDASGNIGVEGRPKSGLSALFSKKSGKESQSVQVVQHEIPLVLPSGQGLWQLGGSNGDPRRRERDLRGAIISSFSDDKMTPLCILAARDSNAAVTGRVTVEASATDFRLRAKVHQNPSKSGPAAAVESIRDGLVSDKQKYSRRAKEAEESLKERVAALALFNFPRVGTRDPMMNLAERRFSIEPLPTTDEGRGQ